MSDVSELDRINTEDLLPYLQGTAMNNKHLDALPDLLPVSDERYKFDVILKGDNNNWLFSPLLQKIFIKMNSVMTINVLHAPTSERLFLRAMILFSNEDEMHLPVKRCANHKQNDNMNMKEHILKCINPYASYYGTESGTIFKDRLSVIVPLDNSTINDDGMSSEKIKYEFTCQNSCSSGINRKVTSVVFTLEDQFYSILGKKAIQFKVCSCPRRDCEREHPIKRKPSGTESFPKGKKPKYIKVSGMPVSVEDIKTEPNDSDSPSSSDNNETERPITVTITMPNAECMKHVLECANNKVFAEMAKHKNNPDYYVKFIKDIRKSQEKILQQE